MNSYIHYLTIIIIVFANLDCTAQKINSGIVEYEIVLIGKEDIESIQDISKRKMFQDISNVLSQKFFLLEFTPQHAFFSALRKLPVERVNSKMTENIVSVMIGESESYYMDNNSKKAYKLDSFDGKDYIIELSEVDDWDFSEETKTILGYKCKKASRTYKQFNAKKGEYVEFNPVVWYCPELSLPYGPIGFGGLPGLVLEGTNNNKIIYRAKNVQLNKKVDIKPKFKGERIDQDKFETLINRM